MISIGTSSSSSTNGTPLGTKNDRKCGPCRAKPMMVTPMNTTAAIAKVTMMWLVGVNE